MPTDALTIAAAVLAVVLVVSAVGKLRSPSRSAEAFRDLRVPAPLRHRAAVEALPWGELLLAVLLVTAGGTLAVVAAVAAVLLFAAYLALVVRALGFETPVDCACFGEFAPGRVTRRTVVRNAWLLALAVANLVLVVGPAGGVSVLGRLSTGGAWAWLVAAGAAALTTWLVTAPTPDAGAPSAAAPASGPPTDEDGDYVRMRTPALPVRLADGTETDLRQLSTQRAQLLLFVSEGCGSCEDVIAAAPRWRTELPAVDVRVVVTVAPGEGALSSTDEPQTVHDPRERLRASFGFWGTPSALLLGADGLLAGGPVTGSAAVPEFVDEIREQLGALA